MAERLLRELFTPLLKNASVPITSAPARSWTSFGRTASKSVSCSFSSDRAPIRPLVGQVSSTAMDELGLGRSRRLYLQTGCPLTTAAVFPGGHPLGAAGGAPGRATAAAGAGAGAAAGAGGLATGGGGGGAGVATRDGGGASGLGGAGGGAGGATLAEGCGVGLGGLAAGGVT